MATKAKMVEMSALVAAKAEETRNVANGDALMAWLGKMAESKLGEKKAELRV